MDANMIFNFVLAFLTLLLGGLNIFQLLTFKAYKRQRNAEADKSEIDALRLIIEGMQAEIGRLQNRLDEAEKRAYENSNKYYSLQQEFENYKSTHK
jgi:peptidoglycan hydrolase CwlO-like protein